MNRPLRVGLTGGIGSGKTTVAGLFRQQGVTVIDADDIAHELVEPGHPGYKAVLEYFGRDIAGASGTLDRKKMRQLVFSDPEKKQALESILHPLVYKEIENRITMIDSAYCIIAIPLLLETGGERHVDRVLAVDCDEEDQIQRAMIRDNTDRDDIMSIMAAQVTRERRLAEADDIIRNDRDISYLVQQVADLDSRYRAMAASANQ